MREERDAWEEGEREEGWKLCVCVCVCIGERSMCERGVGK